MKAGTIPIASHTDIYYYWVREKASVVTFGYTSSNNLFILIYI